MEVTGTVTRVLRRRTSYGSLYLTVDVDGSRFRYLQTGQSVPTHGDRITITGVPVVGSKHVNVGGAQVTIHSR